MQPMLRNKNIQPKKISYTLGSRNTEKTSSCISGNGTFSAQTWKMLIYQKRNLKPQA